MNRLNKKCAAPLLGAVVMLLVAACGGGSGATGNSDQKTLKIGLAGGLLSPVTATQQLGFFSKNGLDVEIVSTSTANLMLNGLVSGSTDMAYASAMNVAPLLASGQKLRVVAGGSVNTFQIIGAKNMGGKSWPESLQQLKGKKLGEPGAGSAPGWMAVNAIQAVGVDPGDVHRVGLGGATQAVAGLDSGQVDAVVVAAAAAGDLIARGYPVLFSYHDPDPSVTYPPQVADFIDQPDFGFWVSADFLQDHEALIKKFRAAMNDSISFLRDTQNLDQIASSLRKSKYNIPSMDDAAFRAYLKEAFSAYTSKYSLKNAASFNSLVHRLQVPGTKGMPDPNEWYAGEGS